MLLLLSALATPSHAADLLVGPAQPYLTLSAALSAAGTGDRVLIDPGVYPENNLTVDGIQLSFEASGGPGTVTIQHQGFGSWLYVDNGGDVTWTGLDFDGQNAGRFSTTLGSSTLSVTDTSITQGATFSDGGGIRVLQTSNLSLTRVDISGCNANTGSALFAQDSSLSVTDSRFTGNDANTRGTIECSGGSSCSVIGSSFEANLAPDGAAIWADGATDTRFERSTVCATGGGRLIYLDNTTAAITEAIFFDNTGLNDALVRVNNNATATLLNNHFVGAASSNDGQAVEVRGIATLTNNLIAFNAGTGAALRTFGPGGVVNAEYNLFFQNAPSHADFGLSATNLVDVDPLLGAFATGTCDFTQLEPTPLSPAIDGGDPTLFGPDGTRSDIGAFVDLEQIDADGDGFNQAIDCDDQDAGIYPGATEIACDGIDQDCDPATVDDPNLDFDALSSCEGDCDDTNPNATVLVDVYFDGDGDGFGRGNNPSQLCGLPANGSLVNGDCNDENPEIYPGAPEPAGSGKDKNCDGEITVDGDGDGVPFGRDCNDRNANRFPGNTEIPGDGIDQDCDDIDAEEVLTGGSGLNCSGCSAPGGSPIGPWWGLGLLLLLRRRETKE